MFLKKKKILKNSFLFSTIFYDFLNLFLLELFYLERNMRCRN